MNFFLDVLGELCSTFYSAKKDDIISFLNGQLAYFSSKYWKSDSSTIEISIEKNGKREKLSIDKDEFVFCHSALVNNHLAMVGTPSNSVSVDDWAH